MKMKCCDILLCLTASLAIASPALAAPADDGNAGLEALNAGDYSRAVVLFSRAIASGKLSQSDLEFAYSERGAAYLKQSKSRAAAADFKKALKLKPGDQDAQAGLAEAASEGNSSQPQAGSSGRGEAAAKAGMDALDSGDFARAIASFTRALQSGSLSSDDQELALLSRGKAYTGRGDYSNAAIDLNRALHMKPDDQDALEAFGKALGHMQARTQVDGIDGLTCTKNFSTVGSVFTGKTYSGFAEYPSVSTLDAFAGTYAAISRHTPVPGMAWQLIGANLESGSITAKLTYADSGRFITFDAHIEADGGGSRVTIKESVPALLPTIDLKGSLCRTLADAPKG